MAIFICCKNPVPCIVQRIVPSNTIITPDNKALMFVQSAGLVLECMCIFALLLCVKSAERASDWASKMQPGCKVSAEF